MTNLAQNHFPVHYLRSIFCFTALHVTSATRLQAYKSTDYSTSFSELTQSTSQQPRHGLEPDKVGVSMKLSWQLPRSNANNKKRFCIRLLSNFLLRTIAKKGQNEYIRTLKQFSPCYFENIPKTAPFDNDSVHIVKEETTDQTTESINYEDITNGDKELEHKLKVLMLEAEVLRQQGCPIPSAEFISNEMWTHLLGLGSRSSRRKYLEFLFKISKKKENIKLKKMEKQKELDEFRLANPKGQKSLTVEEHAASYCLQHNSLFLRFYDSTMNHFYNSKLIKAIQFGQKLVIDCGYEENMSKKENLYCGKQLMLLFAENRNHIDPFDIHFTNFNKQGDIEHSLSKYIPTMYDSDFPINLHESSHLDLFPKQNLIYLTPHCKDEMKEFDHDAIYIIGGIVDKMNNEPLSLAKAKREGIRMQKFPLDTYLSWGAGSGKCLTLNHCVSILLDLRATGDWQTALRHVPKRKLVDVEINTNPRKQLNFSFKREWKPKQ